MTMVSAQQPRLTARRALRGPSAWRAAGRSDSAAAARRRPSLLGQLIGDAPEIAELGGPVSRWPAWLRGAVLIGSCFAGWAGLIWLGLLLARG